MRSLTTPSHRRQRGFTLVELMLAMAIFSFVMLVMTTAVIRLVHFYQSSIDLRATQQAARDISGDITQDAQQSFLATASVATTTVPFGKQPEDAICFFQTPTPPPIGVITTPGFVYGTGVAYYTVNTGANQWALYKAKFSTLAASSTNAGNVNTCPSANIDTAHATLLSTSGTSGSASSGVSLIRFSGTISNDGRLVAIDMVVAGSLELTPADINYVLAPSVPGCVGNNDRYCSITRLQVGEQTREPAS